MESTYILWLACGQGVEFEASMWTACTVCGLYVGSVYNFWPVFISKFADNHS